MPHVDFVTRYNDREIRRMIMKALGELRPDAIRQIISTTNLFPNNCFRELIRQLIERYCRHFVRRLTEWRPRVGHSQDYLTAMIQYPEKWEGFRSDEPWADCADKKLSFFFDANYPRRVREMETFFNN